MLAFTTEQCVYDIAGVEIGGQPGERPTVLVGSIFFEGHKIVTDPEKGTFDEHKARALLDREAAVAAETGNPRFVDVMGGTTEALISHIRFVAENCSAPILVDSPSQRVRIEAINHFAGSSLIPRLVYSSIAEDYTEEELAAIKASGIKSALVLAFNTKAMKPSAKIRLLEEDLLPAAHRAGVENILIDTGVLDVPSVSWTSLAIHEIKECFGYPTGCAPANALYCWEKMRQNDVLDFQAAASAALVMTQTEGADFILYGSLFNSPWVYSAVATMDALIAYGGRFSGVRPATQEHPLYKVF